MTTSITINQTSQLPPRAFGSASPAVPGLLIAFIPPGRCRSDRIRVEPTFSIGRSSKATFTIPDDTISKIHFTITISKQGGAQIEDADSTNGTYVAGNRLIGKKHLANNTVIRAGNGVFVFHSDAVPILQSLPDQSYGIAGQFHSALIVDELKDAARSGRHLVLSGASGTGKELAAQALAMMLNTSAERPKVVIHNCAKFASSEEAATTLFGVTDRIFSGVSARKGLIEEAHGGVLFLDEVHNLPERIQRGLLRVIEDNQTSRIGDTQLRPVSVRFVLATNAEGSTRGLAHDLYARLREITIPTLANRVADIPSIFGRVLTKVLERQGIAAQPVIDLLGSDHFEAMCLDRFPDMNIRGLVDLADRIASRMRGHTSPQEAIAKVFYQRFGSGLVAQRHFNVDESGNQTYEIHRTTIIKTYQECAGNLSATERHLKDQGIPCSRRWLGIYLERWGVK